MLSSKRVVLLLVGSFFLPGKAKETIEILKTPLDKSDELRDKYLNEEGKE